MSLKIIPARLKPEPASAFDSETAGAGLVLFQTDVNKPEFVIRVRAQRFSPDLFYVNEFADRLKQADIHKFNRLFT